MGNDVNNYVHLGPDWDVFAPSQSIAAYIRLTIYKYNFAKCNSGALLAIEINVIKNSVMVFPINTKHKQIKYKINVTTCICAPDLERLASRHGLPVGSRVHLGPRAARPLPECTLQSHRAEPAPNHRTDCYNWDRYTGEEKLARVILFRFFLFGGEAWHIESVLHIDKIDKWKLGSGFWNNVEDPPSMVCTNNMFLVQSIVSRSKYVRFIIFNINIKWLPKEFVYFRSDSTKFVAKYC